MKQVQRIAVRRFLDEGFDAVTVEQVAAEAEVSPMSVYRWFGTKEALVIWDEFDPPILAEVAARLAHAPPLDAVRDAVVALLDDVYDRERALALDRTRLIYAEPALYAASQHNARGLAEALRRVVVDHTPLGDLQARATAGMAVALLEAAIEQWQQDDGRRPLAALLSETFAAVPIATSAAAPGDSP
jgi:AcrR family transcriptional regulator